MSVKPEKPKLTMDEAREIARQAMAAKSESVRRQDAPLAAESFRPPSADAK